MENRKVKILVIEDHLIAKKIAITILKGLDCEVDTAESGREALGLMQTNEYHLILVDIGLPDIDGFELAQEIRKLEKGKSDLPIIALTAHTDNNYKKRCLEAGMNSCFAKPLTTENAQNILESFI